MKSKGRTRRACGGCRVSKVKCSGTVPCDHCLGSNIPCVAKPNSSEIGQQKSPQRRMQYLLFERARLTRALQQLYRQILSGEPWHGDPVTELPTDGPSIHEILQRLEGGNPAESGMGIIATMQEQSPPLSWPGSHESSILDAILPGMSDDSTRDATTKMEGFFVPSSTQVTMPTLMHTPVADVLVRGFNPSSAVFSTTGFPTADFYLPSPQGDERSTCFMNPSGDANFPPWAFSTQPNESSTYGQLFLP